MAVYKVEICGVNTSKLPLLTNEEKEELKEIKKQMTSNQDIQEYYQSYYEINRLLDHVTQIIFKDISQILDTTGYKL